MQFTSERELQDYCLEVLNSKGISAKQEVQADGLRADIVTDSAVLELKKTLTRDAIFQAYGQGTVYQRRLGKRELWIVGQSPKDAEQLRSAQHTANELAREGVKVSFVDSDMFWQMSTRSIQSFKYEEFLERYKLPIAVVFIILCLLIWDGKTRNYQPDNQPDTQTHLINI